MINSLDLFTLENCEKTSNLVKNSLDIGAILYDFLNKADMSKTSKEDFIKEILPLIKFQDNREYTNISLIRQGLINNLEQQKIINPLDKNGSNKTNFTMILEHLWLYGDKEQALFDCYSNLKNNPKFDDIKIQFKQDYKGFFTDKLLNYIKNGTEAFNHNDKFFDYKSTLYGKYFALVFQEAFRIILTPEYLDCIGDGLEQRVEFKNMIQKVSSFFDF